MAKPIVVASLLAFSALSSSCVTRINGKCEPPREYKGKAVETILKEAREIIKRPSEKKAITYCVFGKKPIYVDGVAENIKIAKELYPGWDILVFADSKTVPAEAIAKYKARGAKVYADPSYNHASARFFVADMDYDRFISRDADSPIYPREVAAVADWMKNDWAIVTGMHDKDIHTNPLLAGMWGAEVKPLREKLQLAWGKSNMEQLYKEFMGDKRAKYGDDEEFLKQRVLEAVGNEHFISYESEICDMFPGPSRGFPIPRSIGPEHIGDHG